MKKIVSATKAFSLLFNFILAACKKVKDQLQEAKTVLLNKNWKLISFIVDPAIPGPYVFQNDALSGLDDCEKDDINFFKPNGVFISDEGGTGLQ